MGGPKWTAYKTNRSTQDIYSGPATPLNVFTHQVVVYLYTPQLYQRQKISITPMTTSHTARKRMNVPRGGIFFLAVFLMCIPSAFAELRELEEGQTMTVGTHDIRLKKADTEQGGSCRIKVDNLKDKTIKVGSMKEIANLYIQSFAAEEKKCLLVVTPKKDEVDAEKEYDIIDTFSLPHDEEVSAIKKYETDGHTFITEISRSFNTRGIIITVTREDGVDEQTSLLSEGGIYMLSDQSMIAVLGMENELITIGIKVTVPSPSETSIQEQQQPALSVEQDVFPPSVEQEEHEEKRSEELPRPRKMLTRPDETQIDIMLLREENIQQELTKQQNKCPPDFCYVNNEFDACIEPRMRVRLHDIPSYCDNDGSIKKQKETGESAQQSYECKSNRIEGKKCAPFVKDTRFINRVLQRFTRLFG